MPTYQQGDYVKVEFEGEHGMPGEWMWVRVARCDDERELVFGTLDNESLLDDKLKVGQELAISYAKIREHKTERDFRRS